MSDQVYIPRMAEQPERRYTYGGRVAHLLGYGIDYGSQPYVAAYCRYRPQWGAAWLGSGTQDEEDKANRLPTCKRCNAAAQEIADFLAELAGS